jgi:hypothetical protein
VRLTVGPDGRPGRPEVGTLDAFRDSALWQPVRSGTPDGLVTAYAQARLSAHEVASALEDLWADPDAAPTVRASLDYDGHPVVIVAPVTVAMALALGGLFARQGWAA